MSSGKDPNALFWHLPKNQTKEFKSLFNDNRQRIVLHTNYDNWQRYSLIAARRKSKVKFTLQLIICPLSIPTGWLKYFPSVVFCLYHERSLWIFVEPESNQQSFKSISHTAVFYGVKMSFKPLLGIYCCLKGCVIFL